jgi:hypothetical protein
VVALSAVSMVAHDGARGAHDGSSSPYIAAPDVGAPHVVALSEVSMVAHDGARVAHDGARVAHDGAPLLPVAVG